MADKPKTTLLNNIKERVKYLVINERKFGEDAMLQAFTEEIERIHQRIDQLEKKKNEAKSDP